MSTRLMAVDASFPDDPVSDYDDAPNNTNTGSLNMIAPHSNSVFGSPAPPPSSSATASASAPAAPDVKIDHRKKRRNRTTQSCLSCHQNKRKVCVLSRAVWFAEKSQGFSVTDIGNVVRSRTPVWALHHPWPRTSRPACRLCLLRSRAARAPTGILHEHDL